MSTNDTDDTLGGNRGGAETDAEALKVSKQLALDAVNVIAKLMGGGAASMRGAGVRLSAAVKILEIAGVGALDAEKKHQELLRVLKTKLTPDQYVAVLRAVAGDTEVSSRASAH